MHIDILTIFPEMFSGPLSESIVSRARSEGIVTISIHDLRKWSTDKHHSVDDRPYGGGPGMVMLVEPIALALKDLTAHCSPSTVHCVLTSARGTSFNQQKAQELAKLDHLILIAGHYEGVDQRVADHLADEEISIGNYVLTGGELPAMVITDAVVRLLPGALGDPESAVEESHATPGYVEYPQYTRPEVYRGWAVPKVLLSGNHAEIRSWHQKKTVKQPK
jgi:tRNA (guanine37-N1)-methyltransferase